MNKPYHCGFFFKVKLSFIKLHFKNLLHFRFGTKCLIACIRMKSASAPNVQEAKEKEQKKHSKRLSNLIILNCSKPNFGCLKWLAFQPRTFLMHICEQLANKYCISRLHSLEQKESNSSLLFENDLVSFKCAWRHGLQQRQHRGDYTNCWPKWNHNCYFWRCT